MAHETPSAASVPQPSPAGPTRRGMLFLIPAALFAGWRGLSVRTKAGSGPAEAGSHAPPTAPEQSVSTFSYSYVVAPAEGEAREIYTTVYYYDEDGRPLDHCVLPPIESNSNHPDPA